MKNSTNYKIAGAILAGGNARRLGGIAKGTIKVGEGLSIIDRLVEELTKAGIDDIVIVANDLTPYRHCDVKVISDIRPGIGPIGGIESGLIHFAGQSDAVMFVPCDLPNIAANDLLVLKEAFVKSEAPVVFAETSGFFLHPLCAVVCNELREEISAAIDSGRRKIRDVWRQVKAITVRFPDETAFFNINTLTDMDKWRKSENEKRVFVEISIAERLRELFDRENIDIKIVADQPCDVKIIQCSDHRESDLDIIYSGGWITCETARSLAKKINISLNQMGKLLNHLNVKIRRCGLGCFK
ncbi:MAG: molybdenum cofactor guanylyltransferase [Phycisphaerae bacterium]|jgi:molybdopterin-guanine dinucleotide biosynthesis protein A